MHRFPGEPLRCFKGQWIECDLNNLPNDVFFTTDFLKQNVYYFKGEVCASISNDVIATFIEDHTSESIGFIDVDKDSYVNAVTDFKADFLHNKVEKAIFSRVIKHPLEGGHDWLDVIDRMCDKYLNTCVYLLGGNALGVWCGATPEVLLSGDEKKLTTMALAGTKWKHPIVWTDKEIHEQGLVRDYVSSILKPFDLENYIMSPTATVEAGPVFHLCNYFSFGLSEKYWNSLIEKLHPTPAVGGLPLANALNLIQKHELHQRELYTGLIGLKSTESLKVFVNLRCMQLTGRNTYIYVGGGITADSDPASEWEETENKAKTLTHVLFNE